MSEEDSEQDWPRGYPAPREHVNAQQANLPYGWTKDEENAVTNLVQIAGLTKDGLILRSAFNKMATTQLKRID